MSVPEPASGLQLDEDLAFSKREHRVQRVGRVVWLLVLIAAFLGVFGRGWLSQGRSRSSDGRLRVEYDRIGRSQSPTRLQIDLDPASCTGHGLQLWVGREYLDDCLICMISPEPNQSATSKDRIVYTVEPLTDGSARLTFVVEPEVIGRRTIELGIVDGPELALTQIILP